MRVSFLLKVALVLVVVLFPAVIVIPGGIAASDNLTLSVSGETGGIGDRVDVTVTVENALNSEGGQFVLNFDPELARPVSYEAGALITDASNYLEMANLDYAPGQMMFVWVTPEADTADSGTLYTITFELLKEGESLLEINEIVLSPDGVAVTAEPGAVTVSGSGREPEADPGNDADTEPDQDELTGPDEQADEEIDEDEEAVDDEAGANTFLIVLIILAVLAVAGFVAYKGFKKPGAKMKKR